MDITIELSSPTTEESEAIDSLGDELVQIVSPKRFTGGGEILQALVLLSTVSIPVLGKIIVERIRANKHVVVMAEGKRVCGMSPESAISVLERLREKDG